MVEKNNIPTGYGLLWAVVIFTFIILFVFLFVYGASAGRWECSEYKTIRTERCVSDLNHETVDDCVTIYSTECVSEVWTKQK